MYIDSLNSGDHRNVCVVDYKAVFSFVLFNFY